MKSYAEPPADFPDAILAEDVLEYLRRLDEEFRAEFFEIPKKEGETKI